ncbi:MAG: tannase/feruloyl esterase family alpha/beta hydrolase [Acidobacteriota bacterium]
MKTWYRSLTASAFAAALLGGMLVQSAPVETAAGGGTTCESLSALKLPNTTITTARVVAPGTFTPPTPARGGAPARGADANGPAAIEGQAAAREAVARERVAGRGGAGAVPPVYATLPAFCRVAATIAPSSDSDIKVEVWLPASGWNGKFQAVGNGGWAGTVSYAALAQAVAAGYAAASTDTGHSGNSGAFALGHPEKLIDFGYRAVHEMTVQAKAVVDAFYGAAPTVSFWNGCSLGGRQGITEAQRYPADFDAIIAGAPAVNAMRLHSVRMAMSLQVHATTESYIPPDKYPMIHNAVLEACDALDGVKDGVLELPSRCHFDPKTLECKNGDGPTCLTKPQVETAQALYAPVKHPKTGAVLFPALLERGSELGWATLAGPEPIGTVLDAFKYVVFKDAGWDWRRFNAASDVELAERIDNGVINSAVVDLKPFFNRGGKLLMYHGWSDQQVAAENSVDYFTKVTRAAGTNAVNKSIQLYMVPGMGHCQGGPGTDTFNKMAAMEQWVGTGSAPESIVAAHMTAGKADRTRPLCPYGKVAKWKGTGSTDDAVNFMCVAP